MRTKLLLSGGAGGIRGMLQRSSWGGWKREGGLVGEGASLIMVGAEIRVGFE